MDPEEGRKTAPIQIKSQVDSILITTGGSDIARLSLRILKLFETQIDYHSKLTIILGPGFEPNYVQQLKETAQKLKLTVELVSSPNSLGEYYQKCDFCIATTGLTKYELALYGVPAILISPTHDLFIANKSFEQAKVAINLGLYEQVSDQQLTKNILELIRNQTLRKELSEKSRQLIDGLGVLRLKKDLLERI
jgi:spore coat polysaccharide biosynthesis predicted glycosyltransferase SpsG